jgi:hypothetical protein
MALAETGEKVVESRVAGYQSGLERSAGNDSACAGPQLYDGGSGGLTLTNVLANPVLLIYIFTTTLLRIFPCIGTRSGSLREMTEGSDERRSLAA